MDVTNVSDAIDQARLAHINWLIHVKALLEGMPVEKDISLVPEESNFGKWYYSEGEKVLSHLPLYGTVAEKHHNVHEKYKTIHQLLFNSNSQTYVIKNAKRHFKTDILAKAKSTFVNLNAESEEMLRALLNLKQEYGSLKTFNQPEVVSTTTTPDNPKTSAEQLMSKHSPIQQADSIDAVLGKYGRYVVENL